MIPNGLKILANLFGLAIESTSDLIRNYWRLVRRIWAFVIALFICAFLLYKEELGPVAIFFATIAGTIGILASSLLSYAVRKIMAISPIMKSIVESAGVFAFGGISIAFYLWIDDGYLHPAFVKSFLYVWVILFVLALVPNNEGRMGFIRRWIHVPIMGLAVILGLTRIMPESVLYALENNHTIEKIFGLEPTEIFYYLNERGQIADQETKKPIQFFRTIGNSKVPEALIGKILKLDGRYRLFHLKPRIIGFSPEGRLIYPVEVSHIDIIISQLREDEAQKAKKSFLKAEEERKADEAKAVAKNSLPKTVPATLETPELIPVATQRSLPPPVIPPVVGRGLREEDTWLDIPGQKELVKKSRYVINPLVRIIRSSDKDSMVPVIFGKLLEPIRIDGKSFDSDTEIRLFVNQILPNGYGGSIVTVLPLYLLAPNGNEHKFKREEQMPIAFEIKKIVGGTTGLIRLTLYKTEIYISEGRTIDINLYFPKTP